jgi:hypothetical protein
MIGLLFGLAGHRAGPASYSGELVLLAGLFLLLLGEWIAEPVAEVDTAGDCQYDVDDPGNKQRRRVLAIVGFLIVPDIACLPQLEEKSNDSQEEKAPDADRNPADRARRPTTATNARIHHWKKWPLPRRLNGPPILEMAIFRQTADFRALTTRAQDLEMDHM